MATIFGLGDGYVLYDFHNGTFTGGDQTVPTSEVWVCLSSAGSALTGWNAVSYGAPGSIFMWGFAGAQVVTSGVSFCNSNSITMKFKSVTINTL